MIEAGRSRDERAHRPGTRCRAAAGARPAGAGRDAGAPRQRHRAGDLSGVLEGPRSTVGVDGGIAWLTLADRDAALAG